MRLVSFGDIPAPLPEGFVEALVGQIGEEAGFPEPEVLPEGAPVRIVGGVFDDLTGTLLSAKPRERVFVLLDLLSGPTRVSLRRNQLIEA